MRRKRRCGTPQRAECRKQIQTCLTFSACAATGDQSQLSYHWTNHSHCSWPRLIDSVWIDSVFYNVKIKIQWIAVRIGGSWVAFNNCS